MSAVFDERARIETGPDRFLPRRVAESEPLARIVTAARECFRERGISKTRMGHIAERAVMARQTLYDHVASRTEIIELAIEVRIAELAAQIASTPLPAHDDVHERLVDLFALVVEVVRDDQEYALLAASLGERHAFRYLAGPSPLTPLVAAVFAPLLEDARCHRRLREDVPEQLMVEWLQAMLAMLAARGGLAQGHMRTLLRTFALPTILRTPYLSGL